MLTIIKNENQLLVEYTSDRSNSYGWTDEKLEKHGSVTLRRTFNFESAALVNEANTDEASGESRTFVLATEHGDYYTIDRNILGIKHDLQIWKQMPISEKTFIAYRDISIFRRIDELIDQPIIVGGEAVDSIPITDFEELLKNFPTSTELTHYARTRVAEVLKDYLGTMSDAQQKLDAYLKRKRTISTPSRINFIKSYEPKKFQYVRDELKSMLEKSDAYSEHDWQNLIVGFLLLIFPKYIAVLKNLQIKDFYSDPSKVKNRFIDLTMIDANGTIDIIEIKKPFVNCLLSRHKYRDNYTPRIELAGSVMQVEKYIFHLNKWGRDGEKQILKQRQSDLPPNFELKVTNPQAILILGRDLDFSGEQKFDFEIIKRKYANIVDIMTYDDLLRRLDNIIAMIETNYSKLGTS
jgi:Domain of unknown function (DUF4263)